MRKPRVCKLCRERPATVPDREGVPPKPTPEICGECHAERLRDDLRRIVCVAPRKAGREPEHPVKADCHADPCLAPECSPGDYPEDCVEFDPKTWPGGGAGRAEKGPRA
jgi:hypothetical protein